MLCLLSLFTYAGGNDFVKLYPYVSDAAMFAYPSHKWHPWKFTSLNPSWWDSLSHQQMYITYLAESQNLKPYEDYYALIWPMIESTGGIYCLPFEIFVLDLN